MSYHMNQSAPIAPI